MIKFTADEAQFCVVQDLLLKHFHLNSEDQRFIRCANSWDNLHARLSSLIQHLLQHDFKHLLQVVYFVDINEQQFKEIMQIPDLILITDRLTDLILEREIQKAHYRTQHCKI